MLFTRNKPYTNKTLLAKEDILELIQFERFCRDNALWESMETCFADNSYINISWFKGNGSEFVASSKAMNRYAPHQIHNSQVWINDTRAVAIMQATIQTRLPIQNVEMELQSDAKLVYCLEQDDQGVWHITRLECIYEKDSLTPVKPTTINLPKDDFTDYRSSYACLSYALNAIGYDVNSELQGIDRPNEVNAYYDEIDDWLTFKEEEKEAY